MANIMCMNSSVPLVNLGLGRNRFGDEGVELLSSAISKMSTIRRVNLSETGIRKFSSIMPLIINSTASSNDRILAMNPMTLLFLKMKLTMNLCLKWPIILLATDALSRSNFQRRIRSQRLAGHHSCR